MMTETLKDPDKANEYFANPDFIRLDENTKILMRHAFNSGREYEKSLFSDVLATIVLEVRRYREASR